MEKHFNQKKQTVQILRLNCTDSIWRKARRLYVGRIVEVVIRPDQLRKLSAMVWMFVSPKFTCWKPNAQVMMSVSILWEVIRLWWWSPHEWDWCSYKRDPKDPSPLPSCEGSVRNQQCATWKRSLNGPFFHRELVFPFSRTERNKFGCL